MISSWPFPDSVVLGVTQCCRFVQVTLESYEVPHCRHHIVHYDVHAASMNVRYEVLPLLDCAKMGIKQCQIERAESVTVPGSVDQWATREMDTSDPHGSKIIKCVSEAGDKTSKAQLYAGGIMLPYSPVDVIVGWIAIDEAINSERVKGKTPIGWGCLICCSTHQRSFGELLIKINVLLWFCHWPSNPRCYRCPILIEIPVHLLRVEAQAQNHAVK